MPMRSRRSRLQRGFQFRWEFLEVRLEMTGGSLTVPLDPTFDQFGDQILTIQAYGDGSRAAFGIFDTGASAVTFSADDQSIFQGGGGGIPIKNPGGAAADGIGGGVTGDVSQPGTILADGMHAASLSFDEFGFPSFNLNFGPTSASTGGIQAFVGTPTGSPDLPTITGTPLLARSPDHPAGLAALVDMQGYKLDFSDLSPGLTLAMPDVSFVSPTTTLSAATDGTTSDPLTIPLTPYGSDNFASPGDAITEAPNQTIQGVGVIDASASLTNQNFLVDTGAQLSVISTAEAQSLGLDLEHPETSITVQGVAGQVDVPGYTLKELDLPTSKGGTIHLTNIPIYVLDVAPGIDGILGMNAFNTASKVLFNPNDAAGPTLSVTYLTNPDRGAGSGDGGGAVGALFGRATGLVGTIHGHNLPDLAFKSTPKVAITPTVAAPVYGQAESINVALPADATGTVSLYVGPTKVGTATLAHGSARIAAPVLAPGVSTLKVLYSGDAHHRPAASSPLTLTVTRDGSSVALSASTPRATVGQPITLTAAVSASAPGSGSPSGVVVFRDGSRVLGTATVVHGVATLKVAFAAAGAAHALSAGYLGDADFLASASATLGLGVDRAGTQSTLRADPVSVRSGKTSIPSFQLTIQVAPLSPGQGQPTGTILLHIGDQTRALALVNGKVVITFPLSLLKGKKVYAIYQGDTFFKDSQSATLGF